MRKETIGRCELYLADCMDLMKQYPDKYFDLAIVDPPYGDFGIEHLGHKSPNAKKPDWRKKYWTNRDKNWDVAPSQEYFDELFRISQYAIICGGNYFNLPLSRNFIIWKKHIPEDFSMAMCEYLWTNIKGNAKVFEYRSSDPERFHPTQKPVALYKWLLSKYATTGDKILDTHFGSGSIAVACNELGFNLTASEIDEDYFNAACKRIKEANRQGDLFREAV
jgi:site-specific DNA-methyltransferase (adenine-specific)